MENSTVIHFPVGDKNLEIKNQTPFSGGGHEPKWKVDGTIEGSDVSMIKKEPLSLDLPEKWKDDPVGYTIHMNSIMSDAGLPVIEMGFSVDGNGNKSIWEANLTADGSRLYGPSYLINGDGNDRSTDTIDQKFLEIWNNPQLASQFKSMESLIVDRANSANIQLPPDDEACLLRIRPNGEWGLVIIDITAARENLTMDEDQLYSVNWSSMDGLNTSLHEIDKQIREAIFR